MSLDTKAKTVLKQLKTGVHLVTITDTWLAKDNQDQIIKTKDNEIGVVIRFTNGKNFSYDKTFWIKGKREWEFVKMCAQAGINPAAKKFKEELGLIAESNKPTRRLWIFIKEVHDIDGEKYVQDEITGMPVVNYYIFDYSMCDNPKNKPLRKGDPERNNGEAADDFLSYRQITDAERATMNSKGIVTEKIEASLQNAPKEVRMEKAKEIIGSTAKKSTVMVPNNEFSMEKGQHFELPKKEEQPVLSDDDIFGNDFMPEETVPQVESSNEIPEENNNWVL